MSRSIQTEDALSILRLDIFTAYITKSCATVLGMLEGLKERRYNLDELDVPAPLCNVTTGPKQTRKHVRTGSELASIGNGKMEKW